jgi:hypothetical protein
MKELSSGVNWRVRGVYGLGYFPGKFRERILVRFSLGVSLTGSVVVVVGSDSVVDDLLLNVTDFRRDIVPGVLRIPTLDGLNGDP